MLAISTVAQSLRLQSPAAWTLLAERGMSITFASAPDEFTDELRDLGKFAGIRIGRSLGARGLITGALDILSLLNQPWDLVQVQTPVVAALARLVPRNAPLIYVAHGFHFHRDGNRTTNALTAGVERALAGRANAIAVVCAEDFATAKAHGFHRRTCLWRLPGAGVDLNRFPMTPRPEAGGMRLLFIGELNANKDPIRVLEVVAFLRAAGHPATATIVGDGPLRASVAAGVRDSGGSVQWVRHTPNPETYLQASDMLLLPSRREGLPRVAVEALAAGRPVIARSNRGSRELLRNHFCGQLMLPTSTTADWAHVVISMAARADVGPRMRAAVGPYSTESFTSSYGRLLDRVLSDPDSHGAFDLHEQGGSV